MNLRPIQAINTLKTAEERRRVIMLASSMSYYTPPRRGENAVMAAFCVAVLCFLLLA